MITILDKKKLAKRNMNNTNKNHTDVDTWTVADLVNSLGDKDPKKRKIKIPKFQRNLVWDEGQKKKFIESVKMGFPIGSLLLHKTGSENGFTIYQLIDGLQRSTTLLKYRQNPTSFFDNSEVSEGILSEIKNHRSDISDDITKECVASWIRQLKGFEETDNFSSQDLVDHLDEKLELNFIKEQGQELRKFVQPFTQKVKEDANIFDFRIPIVIYSGEQSHLAEIFSRLNKQGTHLSKYQIYAATWIAFDSFKINNKELILKIKGKYDKLIEGDLRIENYDPLTFEYGDFTVFEYFFGLGKLLIDKFPYLFNDKKGEEESIGFNLGATCLGLGIKSLESLPKYYLKVEQDKFEKALLDSITIVNDILKPYVALRANKKNSTKKITIYHTEYQIVSLIGKIFRSKYDDNLNIRTEWKRSQTKLKTNIPLWYLYDILRGTWRGSPDNIMKTTNGNRYEQPIARHTWEFVLDEWFEADMQRQEKTRANISDTTILFYKYIYTHLLTAKEELSEIEFDIEHLVPIERLKKMIIDNKGLPMSCFANLCLLEKRLNREKGSTTIFEYLTENRSNSRGYKDIERFVLTTKKELSFLENNPTIENYKEFLRQRYLTVRNVFFDKNEIGELTLFSNAVPERIN